MSNKPIFAVVTAYYKSDKIFLFAPFPQLPCAVSSRGALKLAPRI
jgi:hypothetical protein